MDGLGEREMLRNISPFHLYMYKDDGAEQLLKIREGTNSEDNWKTTSKFGWYTGRLNSSRPQRLDRNTQSYYSPTIPTEAGDMKALEKLQDLHIQTTTVSPTGSQLWNK